MENLAVKVFLDIPMRAVYHAMNMTLLICILVVLDILSKWFVLVDRYNIDHNRECTPWNTFRGIFFRAWEKGYLESRKYREDLGRKARAYGACIFVAVVVYLFPDFTMQGLKADETISFLIYLSMVVAECFSIAENLKDLGIKEVAFIKDGILTVLAKFGVNRRVDQEVVKRGEKDNVKRD